MAFRIILITLLMVSVALSVHSLTSGEPFYAIAYMAIMVVCGFGPEFARFFEKFTRWFKRKW